MPDQFSLLLEWRRSEAATRNLAKIPHDFYTSTAAYLADVRRSYEADLRENPSGRKGEISRQTYQRAGQVARDIVEGRAQKILTIAFQTSIGGARELPNALPEEREVYARVLATLFEHRRVTAPYLEYQGGPTPASANPVPALSPGSPAPVGPVVRPPTVSPTARTAAPVFVRVLQDGRPIEVGSETIDLRREDVLSLPPETAQLLVQAKVAEPVETGTGHSNIT
ncbi:MAG: DNA replication complex GINS family protein [Thermoplasmata archaeon]|nr:DNA replication complex GINS family protein [Thermoplasmata archaeon]